MDNTVGFILRNLVTKINFFKCRDDQIFHKIRGKKEPKWVGDTWYDASCHVSCTWHACIMPCRFVQSIKIDRWRKRKERKENKKKGRREDLTASSSEFWHSDGRSSLSPELK